MRNLIEQTFWKKFAEDKQNRGAQDTDEHRRSWVIVSEYCDNEPCDSNGERLIRNVVSKQQRGHE
jgi:hypothetical protein